jgi:hypothetical protein
MGPVVMGQQIVRDLRFRAAARRQCQAQSKQYRGKQYRCNSAAQDIKARARRRYFVIQNCD